ncbi:hypothetical protein, partial [Neisseria meningitidis]|uniref:hypothetical protein n=1 Tax=Neisseria meningitidis TaxID=487 RepID=UPI001C82C645
VCFPFFLLFFLVGRVGPGVQQKGVRAASSNFIRDMWGVGWLQPTNSAKPTHPIPPIPPHQGFLANRRDSAVSVFGGDWRNGWFGLVGMVGLAEVVGLVG